MKMYHAYRTFSEDDAGIIILANNLEEAQHKTLVYYGHPILDRVRIFRGVSPYTVRELEYGDDPMVFAL